MANQFSVDEWNTTESRLTIVLLDLSSSTNAPVGTRSGCTVLSYSKDYVIALAPTLTRGRLVLIVCASRCENPECRRKSPFCECDDPSGNNTRVVFRSETACDPQRLVDAVLPLKAHGQTYIAAPIADLASVALQQVQISQRQQSARQALAFMMGRHPRLGAASQIQRLPLDAAAEVLKWLGPSTVHARVIMAIDGDNNVSCGRPSCQACCAHREEECWLAGQPGLARAVRGLIAATDGIKVNLEMNVTMIGDGAHNRTSELASLCAATGGRYDAVREADRSFIAESFKFYNKLCFKPEHHVRARVQAVKGFMDLVKAHKVMDCGVRTRFVGRDKLTWDALLHVDKQREKLCEKLHGVSCPHGQDRNGCLRSCRERLSASNNPFAHQPRTIDAGRVNTELLECSIFLAKNFEVSDTYSTASVSPQLPPLRLVKPHPANRTSRVSAFAPRPRILPNRANVKSVLRFK